MKRYEKYKNNKEYWLQDLPEHWKVVKFKQLFNERVEKNRPNEVLLTATQSHGVIPKSMYENRIVMVQKDFHLQKFVKIGDFVISLRSFQGGIEYAYYQGIISPAYTIIYSKGEITENYFRILGKSAPFIKLLQTCVTGIREGQNIDYESLKIRYLPVPPRAEQDQIVRYLDWKVSRINKLIHAYQREIKLLEERKLVVINNAVTKGLDPNVEMKDSGVSWIGEIPKRWKKYRIKYLYNERNIRSLTGKEPHLSMSQKKGLVTDDENIERRLLSESYIGAKICHKDDLVLNRLKAHLGVFAIAPILGVVSPDYTVLKINQSIIIPKFAELLLKSSSYRNELKTRVRGIVEGFWRLYTEDLGEIKIYIPNLFEQENIIKFIDDFNYKNNLLILNINRKIELLTEYRTRLISDVVTGQIDVRDVVIPNYEVEEDVIEADDDVNGEEVCDGDEC